MDIQEIKDRRNQMEMAFESCLDKFYEETGVQITSIDISYIFSGPAQKTLSDVDITLTC